MAHSNRSRRLGGGLLAIALFCWVGGVVYSAAGDEVKKAPDKPSAAKPGEAHAAKPGDAHGHAHGDAHAAEHEHKMTAFEEVMDQKERWPITHQLFGGISIPIGWIKIGDYRFPTKYMILELIAAGLICWIYIGLAKRVQTGEPVKGWFWNAFEGLLTFVREDIARPNLGGHGHAEHAHGDHGHDDHGHGDHGHHAVKAVDSVDRYTPFLWTLFLFILFNNLLGMFPFGGSPTANVFVTGALAIVVFLVLHGSGIAEMGPVNYVKALWPKIDIDPMFGFGTVLGLVIKVMIFTIELLGTVIKAFVLAVRLFANMFAGHTVLATILLFIVEAKNLSMPMWSTVTAASVIGVTLLSLLELFVAFLQAYIFTFLTALFLGMTLHPEH